ncbi:MAG: OmpA family protein [Polyangia bacterium]|nr:OmpA family protein [Polyangia bacterium]
MSSPARAQAPAPDSLDVQSYNIAVGQHVYMTQHGARAPEHLAFGVGLAVNYQRNPFSIYNVEADGSRGDLRTAVVKDLLMGEIYGYLGLFKRLTLGLSMPLALYQSGTSVGDTGEPVIGGDLSAFAWGDLALHIKGHFFTLKDTGLSMGALLTVTAPTGLYAENYVGEASATFRPRLLVEYVHRVLSVAVNLGGVFRVKEVEFYEGNFRQAQQFTYGVGFSASPSGKVPLTILAEWFGRTDFSNRVDRNPMEVGLGLAYRLPYGIHLMVGGGAGLLAGIGSPDFRVVLGVKWAPSFKDSDGDGVPDEKDKCPDQSEDRDGFQDDDGCPDPDNDGDGIPDEKDKCPNEAEDKDGFQDEDGCPDLDNDGDSVPDEKDKCPMHPGPSEHKGCPKDMLDSDGDGIPDVRDKCPNEAEDKDGFQDEDGCPDPDNDGDGILDDQDKCPNEAEDKDGFQDDDGCPDPDNDEDGVCDDNPTIQKNLDKYVSRCIGRDKCPGKKETINGVKDADGCPDEGVPLVTLSAQGGPGYMGQFVAPGVGSWFAGGSTNLTAQGTKALDQLAMLLRLKQYDPLRKIVVMAFTEPHLSAAAAKKMSQAWADAVKTFLVEQGIAEKRLGAVGAGGATPKCNQRTLACQRKNRRIEFFITEIRK